MTTPEEKPVVRLPSRAIVTVVFVSLSTAAVLAYWGAASVSFRAWLYGPHYSAARYSGLHGGFQELLEMLIAAVAAGLIGLRLGWLMSSLMTQVIWKRGLRLGRPAVVDLMLIPLLALWGYLIYVSWGPTWGPFTAH